MGRKDTGAVMSAPSWRFYEATEPLWHPPGEQLIVPSVLADIVHGRPTPFERSAKGINDESR